MTLAALPFKSFILFYFILSQPEYVFLVTRLDDSIYYIVRLEHNFSEVGRAKVSYVHSLCRTASAGLYFRGNKYMEESWS